MYIFFEVGVGPVSEARTDWDGGLLCHTSLWEGIHVTRVRGLDLEPELY